MKNILLTAFAMSIAACSGAAAPGAAPGAAPAAAAPAAAAASGSVEGYYRAEGKESKLSFVRAAKGEPRMDEPTIQIAFTEKDASAAKNLSDDAIAFSHNYGSAITVTLYKAKDEPYEITESAFHHSASDKAGGSASGVLQIKDVKVANGEISGEVYTKPDTDMFGAKVDIDLKFKVRLPQ